MNTHMTRLSALAHLLLALTTIFESPARGQASVQGVGDLPGGFISSQAVAISDEGSTVAGLSQTALGPETFSWTSAGGIIGLGNLAEGTCFK